MQTKNEDFKKIIQKEIQNYKNNNKAFKPYYESMKKISQWLKERGES